MGQTILYEREGDLDCVSNFIFNKFSYFKVNFK